MDERKEIERILIEAQFRCFKAWKPYLIHLPKNPIYPNTLDLVDQILASYIHKDRVRNLKTDLRLAHIELWRLYKVICLNENRPQPKRS